MLHHLYDVLFETRQMVVYGEWFPALLLVVLVVCVGKVLTVDRLDMSDLIVHFAIAMHVKSRAWQHVPLLKIPLISYTLLHPTLNILMQDVTKVGNVVTSLVNLQELSMVNKWGYYASNEFFIDSEQRMSKQLNDIGKAHNKKELAEADRGLVNAVLAIARSMSQLHTLELVDKCSNVSLTRWEFGNIREILIHPGML